MLSNLQTHQVGGSAGAGKGGGEQHDASIQRPNQSTIDPSSLTMSDAQNRGTSAKAEGSFVVSYRTGDGKTHTTTISKGDKQAIENAWAKADVDAYNRISKTEWGQHYATQLGSELGLTRGNDYQRSVSTRTSSTGDQAAQLDTAALKGFENSIYGHRALSQIEHEQAAQRFHNALTDPQSADFALVTAAYKGASDSYKAAMQPKDITQAEQAINAPDQSRETPAGIVSGVRTKIGSAKHTLVPSVRKSTKIAAQQSGEAPGKIKKNEHPAEGLKEEEQRQHQTVQGLVNQQQGIIQERKKETPGNMYGELMNGAEGAKDLFGRLTNLW
ncbi:MAG: hypothetical protein ACLP29_11565 [Dissulfurispiraceae bacterium]